MTCISSHSYLAAILLTVAAIVGCGQPVEETAPVAAPAAVTVAVGSAAAERVNALTETVAKTPADGEPDANAATPAVAAAEGDPVDPLEAYQAPFPERVDLFVPPKRQGGMVLTEGGTEEAVELLGFVRLDQPQVVLSINGEVTPIGEGGSQYGIEVISIQPPKVVLQRGRQRWQASLEN
jgi:hypothetical protein